VKVEEMHRRDYLTIEQIKVILSEIDRESLKDSRDYALFLTMTISEMRTIEVCRTDIKDLRVVGKSEVLFTQGRLCEDRYEGRRSRQELFGYEERE
jgi:integrase